MEDPFDKSVNEVMAPDVTTPSSPSQSPTAPPRGTAVVSIKDHNNVTEVSDSRSDPDPLSTLPDDPALDDFFSCFTRQASIATITPTPYCRSRSVALTSLPSAILSSYPSTHSQFHGKSDVCRVAEKQEQQITEINESSAEIPQFSYQESDTNFAIEHEKENNFKSNIMSENLERLLSITSHPNRAELIFIMDAVLALLRQSTAHRHTLLQTIVVKTMDAISVSTLDEYLHMRSTLLLLSVMTAYANAFSTLLLSPQTIRQLLVVLGTYRNNPYIQSRTLAILTPVVRHAIAVPVFVAHRGVELVVWSLENFKSIRPVLTHGCALLRAASIQGGIDVAHRVCRLGILSVMASVLPRWTVTPSVQVAVLAALPAFVGSSATNQWIAGRSSSLVRSVVSVMRSQPYSPVIQLVGSLAMSALCTECAGNRIQAIDTDFMEAAIMALTMFGEDAAIAHAVFSSLENVTTDCPAAQSAYASQETLQVVAHVTRLHKTDVTVMLRSAGCLRRAFRDESVRASASALTTIDALLCVLESIGTSTVNLPDVGQYSTVAEVFAALANGVFACKANARHVCTRNLGQESGLSIVIQTLRWSLSHADAQLHGLRALRNISAQTPLDERSLSDVVHIVLTAIIGHFAHPDVQLQATHCLLNISWLDKGRTEKTDWPKGLDLMRHLCVGDAIETIRGIHGDSAELEDNYDSLLAQTNSSQNMLRRGSDRNQRSRGGRTKDTLSHAERVTMALD